MASSIQLRELDLVMRGAMERPRGEDTLVNENLVRYILERQFGEIMDSSTNEDAFGRASRACKCYVDVCTFCLYMTVHR